MSDIQTRNPRRPGKTPGPLRFAGDPETPGGWRGHLVDFIAWAEAMHYSPHTIKNRRIDVGYFIDWCEERAVMTPQAVTRAMLERYRQHVFYYRRKTDDLPLSFQCQGKRLIAVRVFFQWLTRQHHLMFNPASELELPRPEKRLPRHILTIAEVEQVINTCDTTEPSGLGLRDRAMLETLYSTGMRRSELVELHIDDVDLPRGTVHVRQGKGKKDRVVPIGERACRWVQRYLWEVRERYVELPDDGHLFLAKHGEAMQGKQLSVIVKLAIERANLERFQTTHPNAACHLFRHACATHMLEGGADIRFIQALLGHADLSTTEVYTQVSIGKLKAVHTATHPARLQARQASNADALDPAPQPTADALLRALEQEGSEAVDEC